MLAMDVSSSVDEEEDRLQRQGLASALLAPEVQDAFFVTSDPVAVLVFEWSGRYNQVDLTGWQLIQTQTDLARLSATISQSRRSHNDFPTAMGYAISYAALRFQDAPVCATRTIDISGDGVNNDGFGPPIAYDTHPLDDVTVNGLVINGGEFESETLLIPFYNTQVKKGPGAFVEIANGFADFENTMRRKLIRELSAMILGQTGPVEIGPG